MDHQTANTIQLWIRSLILNEMLTFEGGLNLRMVQADGFATVIITVQKF